MFVVPEPLLIPTIQQGVVHLGHIFLEEHKNGRNC